MKVLHRTSQLVRLAGRGGLTSGPLVRAAVPKASSTPCGEPTPTVCPLTTLYLVPAMDETLLGLAHLLRQNDEPLWADSCERLAADAADAATAGERSDVARAVLRLYQSGMGGFQDVVLQDHGVSPDQGRLDSLRSELFEQAREQL
jgi:hypothetical protein